MTPAAAWRPHLAILGAIVVVSAIAATHPGWLLSLPFRNQMQFFFGLKCPFCGMTRDFVSIWHRQRPVNNPGSVLAAVFIYVVYPLLLGWAWIAKRPQVFQHPLLRRAGFAAIALLWVANNI
jgi:hypothetical protein